ncbi:MAG TPA: STAS domain-containing protein [Anaeromyxobacter sp.]|nr:STAS domain-containing protein [Anaeromyxobacter sp.]
MMDVTHGAHGELVIRLDGNFDAGAANRLCGWLVEVPSSRPLVLDFTHVTKCEDFGLAAVAQDLAARDGLVVRGLTRHHERMLRYLGVTLDGPPLERVEDRDATG